MSINLSKGQRIAIGQTNVTVGLGWTPSQGTGPKFDLDVSVFLLDANKIIPSEEFFVFYNNRQDPQAAVVHSGDCRDGNTSGNGDDERIVIDTTKIDPRVQELIFIVTIDEAEARRQNFGMIRNSYIRIVDNTTGAEIAKYELDESFSVETAVEFGRLYKRGEEWKFDPSPVGHNSDLGAFVSRYYQGPVNK
jgi:tellurium resistance protein TerD